MLKEINIEIKPIRDIGRSSLSRFDCGENNLNTYLKQFAKKNDSLGIGRTYALIERSKVLGYYTVSMAQVEFQSLPKGALVSLPKYPLPAIRIGRLAIDLQSQGKGFGEYLLMDALSRSVRVSEEVAVFAVIVDAKNKRAKKFYLRYGFIPFEDSPLSLFLPISTIRST